MRSTAESAERLANLDGLRGLAALAVALLHGCSIFNLAWVPLHAYLAVDFFFLLSGYAIARAFDRRLQQGWVIGFLWRRMIRLYPFIVVGSLFGFLELMVGGVFAGTLRLSQVVLEFVSALLVVPTPPLISPGWRIFPADSPLWSLFYEIVVNFIYAVSAPLLCNRRLWLLVGSSGLALAYATFLLNGDDFGLVHFKLASLRVLFSFFLGVAFFRVLGPNPKDLAVSRICTPLIFAVFATILFAPTAPERLYDLLAVFMGFPVLLLLALRVSPGTARLRSVYLTFGSWSYPVYVIHVPILVLIFEMFFSRSGSGGRVLGVTLSLAMVIALSWLLIVVYDQPVRRWLSARRRYTLDPNMVVAKKIIRLFSRARLCAPCPLRPGIRRHAQPPGYVGPSADRG